MRSKKGEDNFMVHLIIVALIIVVLVYFIVQYVIGGGEKAATTFNPCDTIAAAKTSSDKPKYYESVSACKAESDLCLSSVYCTTTSILEVEGEDPQTLHCIDNKDDTHIIGFGEKGKGHYICGFKTT